MSYGTQVGTLWTASGPDLDPYGRRVTGRTAVMHAIARRLHTPLGSLSWDPQAGFDLKAQLNATITDARLSHIENSVRAQCLLDERVDDASVAASFDVSLSKLTVEIELLLADESTPFVFVVAVTSLTTELLLGTT